MVPPECWVLMRYKSCTVSSASMLESATPHCSWLKFEFRLLQCTAGTCNLWNSLDLLPAYHCCTSTWLNCAATFPTLTGLNKHLFSERSIRSLISSQGAEREQQSKHLDLVIIQPIQKCERSRLSHLVNRTATTGGATSNLPSGWTFSYSSCKRIWTKSAGMTCIITV